MSETETKQQVPVVAEQSAAVEQAKAVESLKAVGEPLRVPVRVMHNGRVLVFQVPIDDEFKECRRLVAETRAEEAAEREKTRTDADKLLEASAAPFADALGGAVDDCEQFIARMRVRNDDDELSNMARVSALVGAHYADWAAAQTDLAAAEKDAPLLIVRCSRQMTTDGSAHEPWSAPHVLDLCKNDLDKLFDPADVQAFRSFKMHKRSPRVLLLERAYTTPDGPATLSFAFVFAVREDLRAEIAQRTAAGAATAKEQAEETKSEQQQQQQEQKPDDTVPIRTFMKCTLPFNSSEYKDKVEADKAVALRRSRHQQGMQLYEQRRLAKRYERFAAQIPGLMACAIAILSRELAKLYDQTGVKVPTEAVIMEVQCHDGIIIMDETALLSHSRLREALASMVEQMRELEKRIVSERPTADQLGPNEQALRAQFTQLVAEYDKLSEIDQLALHSNTRHDVVFSFINTGSGIDAQQHIGTRFVRRVNVAALCKFNKLTAEKTQAAAAPAAGEMVANEPVAASVSE